jgi:hypothetical protein
MANKTTPGIQNLRGSIGIGTTSPDEKLSVVGNTGLYGTVSGGIVSPASLRFFTSEDGAGLGDSTDSNKQKIGQITWAGKDTSSNAAGEYAAIRTYLIDSNNLIQGSSGEGGQIEFSILRHDVGGDPRVEYTAMTINNSANVGIGTTSPDSKLHIEGSTDGTGAGADAILHVKQTGGWNGNEPWALYVEGYSYLNGFRINAADGIRALHKVASGGQLGFSVSDTAPITFTQSNSTERMRVHTDGNVGIGTTSPSYKLDVVGDIIINDTSDPTLYMRRNDGTPVSAIMLDTSTDNIIIGATNMDELIFRDDSGEGMRLDGSGNLGIGTTSPSEKLHVEGAIWAGTANSTSGSLLLVGKYSNGNITTIGTSYSSGGAVIGYGVKPSTTAAGAFLSSSGLANLERSAYVQHGSTHQWWTGAYQTVAVDSAATLSQSMTLDGSGNLGIGTTSPASKLHVQSGAGIFNVSNDWHQSTYRTHLFRGGGFNSSISEESTAVKIFNGSAVDGKSVGNYWGGIAFMHLDPEYSSWGTTYTGEHFWIGGRLIDTPGQERSALVFATNNVTTSGSHSSEKMVILPNGNVGIGTTSPSQKLDVNGDIAVKGASVINRATAALTIGDIAGTDSVTNLTLTTAGRNTEVFLDDSGNVGINTATPSYNLTVDSGTNDIGILTASSDSGSYVGFLDDSTSTIPKIGAVGNKLILDASQYVGIKRTDPSYALDVSGTIRATGDVIAYSDARVKENVETIPNALDKIKAMRGVGYNKIGEERRSIGVIAQEMLEVMPEAVHKDDSGMYSVAYGNLVGVLIEAMKEQQAQIDELKAKLDGSTK